MNFFDTQFIDHATFLSLRMRRRPSCQVTRAIDVQFISMQPVGNKIIDMHFFDTQFIDNAPFLS